MSLSPFGRFRHRANRAISAHVAMQLADRFEALEERLGRIDESIEALHATLGTLQRTTTEMSATFSDRIRTVEAVLESRLSTGASSAIGKAGVDKP